MKVFTKWMILVVFTVSVNAFDMWKVIQESITNNTTPDGVLSAESDIILNGDIAIDRNEIKILRSPTVKKYEHPNFNWHYKLWKREIPYIVERNLANARSVIEKSLRIIEEASCLRFRKRYSSDDNWLEFYYGQGCNSGIGRKYWTRRATRISIGKNCDHPSIIVHEVLHALVPPAPNAFTGFWHEQSRPDRDSYVRIYNNRILNGFHNQFDKREAGDQNYFGTKYDYKSIMHYSRTSFTNDHKAGNVIEAKFDPNIELGGEVMSPTDKKELNLRYQCHVKSGWGDWSDWSICIQNWRKECTRAKVRYCVSLDWKKCPEANEYGAQSIIEECNIPQCENVPVDGHWGNWGSFSKCLGTCGWGRQTRYRKCDNPAPKNGGQKCYGYEREMYLCRNPRCGGPNDADNDFEKGPKKWTLTKFRIVSGKASSENSGPERDRTGLSTGQSVGSYALASKQETEYRKKVASLMSPWIQPYKKKMCISFYYQLNGLKLHKTNALSIYLMDSQKSYTNFVFRKGGHQGNYWKRAAIDINPQKLPFKIGIEARFPRYGSSDIAIDDIFFDHNPCPSGLEDCRDTGKDCKKRSELGHCREHWRFMMETCCQTCSDPITDKYKYKKRKKCQNEVKNCPELAAKGNCEKSKKWMSEKCCRSCKAVERVKKCTSSTNKHKHCVYWAKTNECEKNPWMAYNCCPACKAHMN